MASGFRGGSAMSDGMKERNFEEDIERWLLTNGGYSKGDPEAFDRQVNHTYEFSAGNGQQWPFLLHQGMYVLMACGHLRVSRGSCSSPAIRFA